MGDSLNDRAFDKSAISKEQNIKNALLLSKLTNENDVKFVYTLVKNANKVYFTCSSVTKKQQKKEISIPYLLEYKGATEKLKKSFENHQTYFGEVTDEYGTFRSIIMLRVTKHGYTYIIGADIDVSFISKKLNDMIFNYIVIFLFFMAGLILFVRKFNTILNNENREKLLAQKRLIEQSKLAQMGEMIGNIAHQWRQPLGEINSIMMKLESQYKHQVLDKKSLESTINQIENITDYMSITIDNFSTHIKNDKEEVNFKVSDMIKRSLSLMQTVMQKHHINIVLEVKDDKIIKGDEGRFIQVIIAIVQNAKDAFILQKTTESKDIKISLFNQKNNFIINIKNSGEHIADGIIEHIFEPYFTTKFKSKGTGIGLYLSKIIVEKTFHAKLEVENTTDGVEFKIIL